MILLLGCPHSLRADEPPGRDQAFMKELDSIKSPFEDGFPQPVIISQPVIRPKAPIRRVIKPPKVKVVVKEPMVKLPTLDLQGVIVGKGIRQAIINDKVVPLHGLIEGARVIAVNKRGVRLLFKGKKFFLKVD